MKKQPQWINSTAERLLKGIGSLRSILLPALLLTCAHLVNGEIKSTIFTHETVETTALNLGYDFSSGHVPDKIKNLKLNSIQSVQVEEGESLKLISQRSSVTEVQTPDRPNGPAYYGVSELDSKLGNYATYAEKDGIKFNLQNGQTIAGPCKIFAIITPPYKAKLSRDRDGSNNKAVVSYGKLYYLNTYEISRSNSSSGKVLVLPKGTGVNELILESSEDLITWEKDVPGDKNTDAANRFYRLRAVKK